MAKNSIDDSSEQICRTCLGKKGVTNSLFGEEAIDGKSIKLNDILSMCTEVMISQKDTLPSHICDDCVEHLRRSYNFNQKTLKAQYFLKTLNQNQQIPFISSSKIEIINIAKIKVEENDKILKKKSTKETFPKKEIRILPKSSVDKAQAKPIILYNTQRNLKIPPNPQMILLSNDPKSISFGSGVTLAKLQGKPLQLRESLQNNRLPEMMLFPCSMCGKQFVSSECLDTHMQHIHLEIKPSKSCSVCNVSFESAEQLTRHNLEVHFPSQPFSKILCEICKKEYKNKYLLARHQKKSHSDKAEEKYACDKCRKNYSTASGLLAHKRIRCSTDVHSPGKQQDVSCRLCEKTFVSARNLAQHMKCHSGLSCRFCAQSFRSEAELRLHSEIHAGQDRPFSCMYCAKIFSAKKVLLRHQRVRHGVTRELLLCGYCGPGVDFGFLGPSGVASHMKIHHPINSSDQELQNISVQQTCEPPDEEGKYIITYYISGERELIEATQEVGPEDSRQRAWVNKMGDPSQFLNSITWDEVGQPEVQNNNAVEHHELEDQNPVFKQESCLMSIEEVPNIVAMEENLSERVSIQVDTHTGWVTYLDGQGSEVNTAEPDINRDQEKDLLTKSSQSGLTLFTCHICGDKFLRGYLLKRHLFKKHDTRYYNRAVSLNKFKIKSENVEHDAKAPYACHICDKKFLRLVNLEKHASHHRAGPPQCPRCGLQCDGRQELTVHLQKCRTADKLACPTCGKKLTTAGGLRYHLKTHSALRRFACSPCGRRFLTASNLRAHERVVHSNVRPHACSTCERRFATADHLRKHQAGHHGKRDHLCSVCGQGFLQSSHVAQHMWIHTGVKPHHCPHCPNKYTAKCSLTKHLRRNHWEQQRQKHIAEERIYSKLCGDDDNESVPENSGSVPGDDLTIFTDSNALSDQQDTFQDESLQIETENLGLDVEHLDGADIVMEEIVGTDLGEGVSVVIVGNCIDSEDVSGMDESVHQYDL